MSRVEIAMLQPLARNLVKQRKERKMADRWMSDKQSMNVMDIDWDQYDIFTSLEFPQCGLPVQVSWSYDNPIGLRCCSSRCCQNSAKTKPQASHEDY